MNNRQTPLLISSCVLNSDNPIYEQADRIELSYYDFISENSVEFTINKTYRINKNNIHTAKFQDFGLDYAVDSAGSVYYADDYVCKLLICNKYRPNFDVSVDIKD